MPAARSRAQAPEVLVNPLEAAPEPPALSCPGGHSGHQPGAAFCSECGRKLVVIAPAAPRPDSLLAQLAATRAARQHSAADVVTNSVGNASEQITTPGGEPYDRDPAHDPRVVDLVMRGASQAEVDRMLWQVGREHWLAVKAGEGTGQQVTGPPRPSHWLTPSARAREEAVQLGQTMMPRDRRQPHDSAVTVTPLPAEARPPGWAEDRRCSSGHSLHSVATACGICGSSAVFDESPDPPLPPSRYPLGEGIFGGIGGR